MSKIDKCIQDGYVGKYRLHKGQVLPSNNFGDMIILELKGHRDALVEFVLTKNTRWVTQSCLVRGEVKDKLFGVGFNSKTIYPAKNQKCYDHWKTMIMRAYDPDYSLKHSTYKNVSVSEDWFDYQNFAGWYHSLSYEVRGYNLDKDLLYVGNSIYSEKNLLYVTSRNKQSYYRG